MVPIIPSSVPRGANVLGTVATGVGLGVVTGGAVVGVMDTSLADNDSESPDITTFVIQSW